jgi:hypothetical protein
MTIEEMLATAVKRRAEKGLKLTFITPDSSEPFVCYPKDEAQKVAWIASSERKGWKLVQ